MINNFSNFFCIKKISYIDIDWIQKEIKVDPNKTEAKAVRKEFEKQKVTVSLKEIIAENVIHNKGAFIKSNLNNSFDKLREEAGFTKEYVHMQTLDIEL